MGASESTLRSAALLLVLDRREEISQNNMDYLKAEEFKIAFVVVRPNLMEVAHSYWEKANILEIENGENIDLVSKNILHQIEAKLTR